METTKTTYQIPEENLDKLKHQLAKLASRCRRVKIAEPVLTVGEYTDKTYQVRNDYDEMETRVRRVYEVTLESAGRPKIEGYEFAAVISPVTDEDGKLIGNVVRRVPGFEVEFPTSLRDVTNYCDHCKTTRRRLETFVIYSAAGFRQIGRNCLGYYLGLTDPDRLANIAQLLIDADDLMGMAEDEGFGGGSGVSPRILLTEVLEVSAAAIRLYGWLSNASAREFDKTSTSSRVVDWVFGNAKAREQFEFKLTPSPEDKALAAETIEWLGTIDPQTDNDYLYNLQLLAKSISVKAKNFGIAVSAINAFSKEKEFKIRRNARIEADVKSNYIGTEGDRQMFENAIVVYTNTFESEFGVSHLYKMKIGDDVVVYFSSRDMGWEQGATVSFKASIKKHELRKDKYSPDGVKQTVVTRAIDAATLAAIEAEKAEKKAAKKLEKEIKKLGIAWG